MFTLSSPSAFSCIFIQNLSGNLITPRNLILKLAQESIFLGRTKKNLIQNHCIFRAE